MALTPVTRHEPDRRLVRGLTAFDTTALVVGTVIGTGVFLKAAVMAQVVRTPALVLAAWVAAGLLSLAGALAYAELGAMLPEAGGEYVYLRESYGPAAAFLFGWQRFFVGGSASVASIASGFAIFLAAFVPLGEAWVRRDVTLLGQTFEWQLGPRQLVAVAAIVLLSAVNCLAVATGGRVQSALTVLKVGGIAFVVLGILLFGRGADWSHLRAPASAPAWSGFAAFGTAMLAALWPYDGWNNMPMAAGEVKDPGRNIPRALFGGMVIVIAIYCSANLAYFYALPVEEVASSNSTLHRDALPVASKAAMTFLGEYGGKLVAIAFVVSALGALNGSILSNARVPFAMARDGYLAARLAELHPRTLVPVRVIVVQAVWSSLLAVSGSYDQLTDCLIFASWIFYGLTASAVFVLRRRRPDAPRPYRTLGYPLVPALFVLVAGWLVVNTALERPVESVTGIVLILVGLPVYAVFHAHAARRA
jgi:basic amino acid/polyamine antiporter, APA family